MSQMKCHIAADRGPLCKEWQKGDALHVEFETIEWVTCEKCLRALRDQVKNMLKDDTLDG